MATVPDEPGVPDNYNPLESAVIKLVWLTIPLISHFLRRSTLWNSEARERTAD